MAASSSDIREWLREQGRDMPANGRLKQADRDAYAAAHDGAAPPDDDVSYPGDDDEAVSDSAGTGEQAPRTTRRTARSAASGWLGGRRKAKTGKGSKTRRVFARVPLNRLIEHSWSDMAWAAQGMPPMARLLEAQAPLAGVVFEDALRDTAVDKLLQPAARLEEKLDATYGMLAPPFYVLAAMQTAPLPGHEPSVAHKAAFVGLRHSLLVMARIGGDSLEAVERRGRENQQRTADVDRFIRYLFDFPEPPPAEQAAPTPADQVSDLYESATLGATAAPA